MARSKKNINGEKSRNAFRNVLILALIVIFGLLLRIFFFNGVGLSDSLEYSRYANAMSTGNFPPAEYDHGIGRIGLIIPIAFFYRIFGVDEISSVLFNLLSSIGEIILIYFFARLMFNENVGLISAFLLCIFPLDVVNSTRMVSDLPSAFFASFSAFVFLKAEKNYERSKSRMLYLLSGMLFGAAYFIREMAILMSLFFLGYAVYKRKIKKEYFIMGLGFLIIFLIEMLVFYHYTGDPLFKINSLNSDSLLAVLKQINYYGRTEIPKFFLTWPFVIYGDIMLGYFYLFISLAAIYYLLNRKQDTNCLLIWFLSILLYLYLGSQSLRTYAPFVAVGRYLTFVAFPGLLLLGSFLYEKEKIIRKLILPFALIFLFLTSIGAIYLETNKTLYGTQKVIGIKTVKETYKNDVYPLLKSFNKPVYTDERSVNILRYISKFDKSFNLISYDANLGKINNLSDVYIMINNKEAFGKSIALIPYNWIKIKEIKDDPYEPIVVYYAK